MANETLNTIVNIQPKDSGGGGGETRESTVQRLANEMLEKLPPDYIPHEVKYKTPQLDFVWGNKYQSKFLNVINSLSLIATVLFLYWK